MNNVRPLNTVWSERARHATSYRLIGVLTGRVESEQFHNV
jgi:hypothetical protein